ncbi:MAG TPA: 4Fe-4S dicluster domain-containing protein [Rhizobiales bacterium]|nr:4Fe-4S dicluster domain-containing protein [Hyphomicrobiales bacterium]
MSTSDKNTADLARRRFLSGAVALGSVSLASGFTLYTAKARPKGEPASSKILWGLLIDTSKCEGCNICVEACKTENGWEGHRGNLTDPQWIRKVDLTDRKTGRKSSLPVMCQHCESPPCVDVCPVGASMKRADGIVLVDRHLCIGCRYCMMACPYGARSFVHEEIHDQKPYMPRGQGTVEACTLCAHRIDDDRLPACVEACTKSGREAMLFGDLNDPGSAISKRVAEIATIKLRADLGLDPHVQYVNL